MTVTVSPWTVAADEWEAPPVDPFDAIGYEPFAPQQKFHEATEDDVLYGGSAGGGKSQALIADMILKCQQHPGLRCLTVRNTYDEFNESLFPALAGFGWAEALGAYWHGTARELRFPNRSVIRFRYLEGKQALTRRQGGQYQYLAVDERTLIPPGSVAVLQTERLRTTKTGPPIIGTRSTSNPGGADHAECKRVFIDATGYDYAPEGWKRIYRTTVDHLTRRFIPAKATDNPHLDPAYFRNLDAIPDPQRRAAMRDGSWDIFSGQAFSTWRADRHVVPADLPLADTWQRWAGIDGGFAAPWAVLWIAVDQDHRAWVYRGIHRTKVLDAEQAKLILALERGGQDGRVRRIADSAMWTTDGRGASTATTYQQNGCHITPAQKGPGSRVARVRLMHDFLADIPACLYHREQGWETCPKLHVLADSSTESLRRTLPALPYDSVHVEDVDTKADDHDFDALTYALSVIAKSGRPARSTSVADIRIA